MNKQEALDKITELQEFVQALDKPKLVRVYVKESPRTSNPYWSQSMNYLKGSLQTPVSASHDRVHFRDVGGLSWEVHREDVVLVEGSYNDLEEK